MNRYGGDYNRGWGRGYDTEHRHWGTNPRYDRQFGRQSGRQYGRQYDRQFSFDQARRPSYDRDFSGYGPRHSGYNAGFGRGAGRHAGGFRGGQQDINANRDFEAYEMDIMSRRRPVSPWGPNVPGQNFGLSLGYGIGAGRYIHK
jgi:hypothetical protein